MRKPTVVVMATGSGKSFLLGTVVAHFAARAAKPKAAR